MLRRMVIAAIALSAVELMLGDRAAAQVLQDLTPEQIKQALADEKADGCYSLSSGSWMIGKVPVGCFTTPYARVVAVAASARKKYKTATEADITPEVIAAGELHVHAFATSTGGPGMANVETVVIAPRKNKERSKATHPVKTSETTADYKNLMGASFEGKSMTAVFPLSLLSETNEVHIVYDKDLGKPAFCTDRGHLEASIQRRPRPVHRPVLASDAPTTPRRCRAQLGGGRLLVRAADHPSLNVSHG